jgi:excisionase family DNA binding protein
MSSDKILLTAEEVATLTGFAEGTIRHFVSQKRIPVVRISARCVRFRRSDIETWLEEMLIPAVPASEQFNAAIKNRGIRRGKQAA